MRGSLYLLLVGRWLREPRSGRGQAGNSAAISRPRTADRLGARRAALGELAVLELAAHRLLVRALHEPPLGILARRRKRDRRGSQREDGERGQPQAHWHTPFIAPQLYAHNRLRANVF